jgi:hypothetical protein
MFVVVRCDGLRMHYFCGKYYGAGATTTVGQVQWSDKRWCRFADRLTATTIKQRLQPLQEKGTRLLVMGAPKPAKVG